MKYAFKTTLVILILILGYNSSFSQKVFKIESVAKAEYGKAPDFTWTDGDKKVTFSEFTKGKAVFLNFWGTWCGPCKREIPDIIALTSELSGKEIVIIGIALEKNSETAIENVSKFAKEKNINYINLIDASRELSTAVGGINAVPTTFIIDKDKNIVQQKVGMGNKESFMELIKKVLK